MKADKKSRHLSQYFQNFRILGFIGYKISSQCQGKQTNKYIYISFQFCSWATTESQCMVEVFNPRIRQVMMHFESLIDRSHLTCLHPIQMMDTDISINTENLSPYMVNKYKDHYLHLHLQSMN